MRLKVSSILILPAGGEIAGLGFVSAAKGQWFRLNTVLREFCKIGYFKRAEEVAKRLLEMALMGGDEEDTDEEKSDIKVAGALNNLALIYYKQGRYKEARPLYKEALDITEKSGGKEHPNLAIILNNLALLCCRQNDYEEAELMCRKSLEITESVFGKEHRYVAIVLNTLASLCYDQGRYEEVTRLCQRILSIREALLGSDHPWLIQILRNLSELYRKSGNISNANIAENRIAILKRKYRVKNS